MCPRPNSLLTQSRRGEEGRDLVQPHDGSENQPPPSPPLTVLLPLPARGLFLTPPHSFSAIHSFLSSSFWKERKKNLFLLPFIEARSADYPVWFGYVKFFFVIAPCTVFTVGMEKCLLFMCAFSKSKSATFPGL